MTQTTDRDQDTDTAQVKTDQTAETQPALPYAHGGTMTQTTDRDQDTDTAQALEDAMRECRVTREAWGVACRATDRARNSRERVERRVDERIARIAHTRACYRWWKLETAIRAQRAS